MICPDCNGKREIALFTSVVKCERCQGVGQVAAVPAQFTDPKLGEPHDIFDPVMLPRIPVIDPRRPNFQNLTKKDLYATLYGGGRPMTFGFIQDDGSIGPNLPDRVPIFSQLCREYVLPRHVAEKYFAKLKELNDG